VLRTVIDRDDSQPADIEPQGRRFEPVEDLGVVPPGMTSLENGGLAGIREHCLDERQDLDAETRVLLFCSTTRMERLRSLFGLAGDNCRKLAGA
jgi:hypothetical protein